MPNDLAISGRRSRTPGRRFAVHAAVRCIALFKSLNVSWFVGV